MCDLTYFVSSELSTELVSHGALDPLMITYEIESLAALTNFAISCPNLTTQIFLDYDYLSKIEPAIKKSDSEFPLFTLECLLNHVPS